MLNPDFAVAGSFITLIGALRYAIDTVKGTNQPNRISWGLWSFAAAIAFAGELSKHVGIQAVMTLFASLGTFCVLAASFFNRNAYWKADTFDWGCALLSLLALFLWWRTGNGSVAITLSIAADLLASLPTIKDAYRNPENESSIAYIAEGLGGATVLLTINRWTMANYAFPAYIILVDIAIVGSVWIGTMRAKKSPANESIDIEPAIE